MGFLNDIIGNRKGSAKDRVVEAEKRVALWEQHLLNHAEREALVKAFSFANVDSALANLEETQRILGELERLISPEVVSIGADEKFEPEIISDVSRLKPAHELHSVIADIAISSLFPEKLECCCPVLVPE